MHQRLQFLRRTFSPQKLEITDVIQKNQVMGALSLVLACIAFYGDYFHLHRGLVAMLALWFAKNAVLGIM